MTSASTLLKLLSLLATLLTAHGTAISSIPIRPVHNAIYNQIHIPRGGAAAAAAAITKSTSSANTNNNNPLTTFLQTISQARSHLAAAACARATSIFGMYPVDTIKTRMQIGGGGGGKFQLGGLYKGVWGSLIGQVPYG